jgi:probable phosphoglycerate mutase
MILPLEQRSFFIGRSFYMMRHGETEANLRDVLSGATETPLTELGRSQAVAARAVLAQLPVAPRSVVHSSLSRARETAHITADGCGLPFFEEPLLGERDFGDWVGSPYADYIARRAAGLDPPNGESAALFRARLAEAFARVLSAHEWPLIVSHGGVFRGFGELFGVMLGGVKNCALYRFEPHETESTFPWAVTSYAAMPEGQVVLERFSPKPF